MANPWDNAALICALPEEAQALGLEGRVHCAGMGPSRAQAAARAACTKTRPSALISVGLCAGLDPALKTGTVLLGTHIGLIVLEASLRERLSLQLKALAPQHVRFAANDSLLLNASDKHHLAKTGAQAADMESAAILAVAQEKGIPFALLRVVSDDAHMALPTFLPRTNTAEGFVSKTRLLSETLRNPGQCASVVSMALAGMKACRTLRRIGAELTHAQR